MEEVTTWHWARKAEEMIDRHPSAVRYQLPSTVPRVYNPPHGQYNTLPYLMETSLESSGEAVIVTQARGSPKHNQTKQTCLPLCPGYTSGRRRLSERRRLVT